MSRLEDRLRELGLALPPPKAPVANYLGAKESGDLLFVSGRVSAQRGEAGSEISTAQAKTAARDTLLDILAILESDIGDLDRIVSVEKLQGFVRSAPSFTEQPEVINGASDLWVELLGENGRHARTATGAAQLPFGATVQLDMVLRLRARDLKQTRSHMELRDMTESDLPTLFEFQLDPEATQMAAFPSRDHDAFMAHWGRISKIPTAYKKTIFVDGRIVGSLMSWEADGERDVGYWIGKEFWGRGYATRALALFLTQIEERPLYAHVAKHNVGSMRVLEKCGFRVAGADEQVAPTIDDGIEEVILILDPPLRTAPEIR